MVGSLEQRRGIPSKPPQQILREGQLGLGSAPLTSPNIVKVMGHVTNYTLHGVVCVVTGASRGLGKGIAEELAAAGCIVYLTGRSTATQRAEALLAGTVDETTEVVTQKGGLGVASYVDHSIDDEGKMFVELLRQNHNRLDILINNAFLISKPDNLFFGPPVWQQPCRLLDEQFCVGSRNHIFLTMLCRPLLTGPNALVCMVSSGGSQGNTNVFPLAYHVNKACFDRMSSSLAYQLQKKSSISCVTIWPGIVRTERMVLGQRHFAGWLVDPETTNFTGRAICALAEMSEEARLRLSGRVITSIDMMYMMGGHDIDGYKHDGHAESHWVISRCTQPNAVPISRYGS